MRETKDRRDTGATDSHCTADVHPTEGNGTSTTKDVLTAKE